MGLTRPTDVPADNSWERRPSLPAGFWQQPTDRCMQAGMGGAPRVFLSFQAVATRHIEILRISPGTHRFLHSFFVFFVSSWLLSSFAFPFVAIFPFYS